MNTSTPPPIPDAVGSPLAAGEAAFLRDRVVPYVANSYERALRHAKETRSTFLGARAGSVGAYRAVDAYVLASIALWRAAEAVCDAENLPEDGNAAGIIWRLPISDGCPPIGVNRDGVDVRIGAEDTPAQARARLADERCPTCGRLGFRSSCPTCERSDR